ncbi:MAG: efflux RND transporter periplasmic adaptor subunit [Methylomicrobium sp.]
MTTSPHWATFVQNLLKSSCTGLKISFVFIVLLTSVACDTDKTVASLAEPPPPTVQVITVQPQQVAIHQEWVGTLDGMINAQIVAQVSGYLLAQRYQEGQVVKKGQLLYEIDPRVAEAALEGARSQLARQEALLKTARLDLARVKRLLPENAISARDYDNAVGREASALAEVMAAKAAVENARLQLGFTRITSPIDGVAGLSKAQIGDLVGPGSANALLTTVSQLDPIKAYIPLSEQQYLQLAAQRRNGRIEQSNHAIELILADGSVHPYPGTFLFADREADIKTGTLQIAISFPNPNNLLRPGLYAKIRAVIRVKNDALLIPQRAVIDRQGQNIVAVVDADQTVEMRPVSVAESVGNDYVIEKGLKAGERVVVEGLLKIRPGAPVLPQPYPIAVR